jgi:hypothetical protein
MPRPRTDGLLDRLRAEADALAVRIKQEEERDKARKAREDVRRWQLAGQVAIEQMQAAPEGEFFRTMLSLLDRHVRAAGDRALFGLPADKATKAAAANGTGQPG